MAIKTCTGVTGRPYVHVEVRLSQSATITATGLDAPLVTNATGDVTGAYSITLWANNDLTPNGTYYTVTEYLGTTDNTFTIQVPQTAGPFTMPSILVTAPTASPSPNHVSTLIVDTTAAVGSLTVTAGETGIDTAAAGVLEIGGDNATSVEIGPANVLVDASGNVAGRSFTASAISPYAPNSEAATGASLISKEFWLGPPGGGADDQALFDNAMILIAAQGGGTLNCQPGTYRAEPRLKSYIKLKGANHYATIIHRRTASTTADVIALFDARQEQCEIEDLQVDGDTAGSGSAGVGHGIYIHNDSVTNGAFASNLLNPRHRIRNVFVRFCFGDGVKLDGDGNGGASEVAGVHTYYCNGNGFNNNTPDSMFSNCDSGQSGLAGYVENAGNTRYMACKAWLSGRVTAAAGFGFKVSSLLNSAGASLAACVAQDNAKDGFTFFNSRGVIAEGLIADSNGRGATGSGVFMDGAQGCRVTVTAFDRQGVPTQQYAVSMGSGVKNIVRLVSGPEAVGAILAADLTTDNVITVEQPGSTASSRFGGTSSFDALTALTSIVIGSNAGAGGSQFTINGAAASNRDILVQTAGVLRWIWRINNTAEGGADAGSDLTLVPRTDAGGAKTAMFTMFRANGLTVWGDGYDFQLGTGTGTRWGTGATQKLGFYGATAIAQRAGAAQAAVVTTASTQTTPWGFSTQAQADALVTLANELRAWAVVQGFIKGSA